MGICKLKGFVCLRCTVNVKSKPKNHYSVSRSISLFGCNVGFIPAMLRPVLSSDASEPYSWHVDVKRSLSELGTSRSDDLDRPDATSKAAFDFTLQLIDVWGYSMNNWTPLMFHLQSLFIEEDPSPYNKQNFNRNDDIKGIPFFR